MPRPSAVSLLRCCGYGTGVYSVKISAYRKSVARFTFEGLPTAYRFSLMIPQSDTERVLDEFLNSLGLRVEGTIELTRFTAYNDKVVSTPGESSPETRAEDESTIHYARG
jgi:hypothetical protein